MGDIKQCEWSLFFFTSGVLSAQSGYMSQTSQSIHKGAF